MRGWSLRIRLTGLAAAGVAFALLLAGPAWLRAVEHRMLENLRERDLVRALRQSFFRVRLLESGSMLGDGPLRGPVVPIDGYSDSDLLLISPTGDVEFSGPGSAPPAELEQWLDDWRGDARLDEAAAQMGAMLAESEATVRTCMRSQFFEQFGSGTSLQLSDRIATAMEACRDVIDEARTSVFRRVEPLQWPQEVVALPDGRRRLRTAILVRLEDAPGPHAFALDSSLESVDATLDALTRTLLFGGPMLIAFVSFLAWLLVGRSLRVVGDLQREAEQIAFGTLDRRIEVPPADDEVRGLVISLNRMLDRVAEGAGRQRAFVGDASHELRSPIAALRAQLEVGLAHPEEADWPRRAEDATEEVIRMQQLVDDLLRMARLEETKSSTNAPPRPLADVDLDEVVRSEAAALREAKVSLSGVSPVRIRGVEADLVRVVRNLLENAERYGNRHIQVSLSARGDEARLEIEDDGPGIPAEEREHVFERFTRLDPSRSRSSGGAGLGLSLVRGLVHEHGGEIWIEEGGIGGARIVVVLPLDPAGAPMVRA